MAAAGRNGPLAPHMRPCAPRQRVEWMGDNPPSLQMYSLRRLRVFMALKVLLCSGDDELPQHWSVLRAINTLNSPKNYICKLGGLSPIHLMHWRGVQGLMWGARGPFPLAADGWLWLCWLMLAVGGVRQINLLRNSKNCLQKYFFNSYVDPIHS
jgi:hypothetical protein